MKPIIFARIADMDYYRGVTDTDKPENGGAYIRENGYGGECYNFDPINVDDKEVCLGYVMLTGTANQICLENIIGGSCLSKDTVAEGVIVVWCAKSRTRHTTQVVGFYKNATVYRRPQQVDIYDNDGNLCDVQQFNFVADKEDCVLLPRKERDNRSKWYIPLSGNYGYNFGFGRSQIWFANGKDYNENEMNFVKKMINNIENYDGENWMNKEVL